ncbi:hypothetical protein C2G38_2220445 [Gigaspora rosea]|uniref:Uncharacterized protein n=1 Tax=Gigaspora rosea TaxID=44941 RepID=A0A397UCT4_9GLOM|nr:hypothetical protein C2G38_2220445 [Gigaspora rosea]
MPHEKTLEAYPYLEVGKQLCYTHYCKLVEPYGYKSKKNIQRENVLDLMLIDLDLTSNNILEPIDLLSNNNTFASSIDMLTKALYFQQRQECTGLELDPVNFERMIETINPGLKGFFNYLTNAIIPKERSAYNISKAKKSENNFHVYDIDDYHSIHENRRPDMVSTSIANHFATCVAKPIVGCSSVPLVFNGVSVYNSANVEASRQSQGHLVSNSFDPIELLTIHSYADNIEERKEERSIKGLQLLGFKEQSLHGVHDYVNVLNLILSINNKTQHLNRRFAPIVADWPGQIFIRKALYMRTLPESSFSQQIESFLPILGLLHVSLNSREQVLMIYHSFFEKLFHYVFGEGKVLAKKPRPWRINLLLELMRNGWLKIKDKSSKNLAEFAKTSSIEP